MSSPAKAVLSTLTKADLPAMLLVTIGYVVFGKIGLLGANQSISSVFWPASGFALAIALIRGKNCFPALFLGAYLTNLDDDFPQTVSLAIAAGSTLETFIAWQLLKRSRQFNSQLKTTEDFFTLVTCVAVAAIVSAIIGPACLVAAGLMAPAAFRVAILHWWMGNVLGMVFLTTGILVWLSRKGWRQDAKPHETFLLFVLTILIGAKVFYDPWLFAGNAKSLATPIWILPFVLWSALRFNIKTTSLLYLSTFIQTLWGAHLGVGYFGLVTDNYGEFWLYLMIVTGGGMALAINTEERKRLRRHLELTEFAMDNASVEIYWINANGYIEYANSLSCESLGYSLPELQRLTIPDIDPLFSNDQWQQHWQQLKTGKTIQLETQHQRKDGSIKPLEVSANYIRFDDVEYNVAFARDISRRKQSEAALKASEQRFRDLFNHSPDPCLLIENNRFVACNRAANEILGYQESDEALLLQHPAQLSPEFQRDGQSSQFMADEMMSIAWQQGVHRFKWLHQHRDGHPITMEITLAKIRIDQKDLLYCVWRDISDAERLASNLDKERRQLNKTEEIARLGSWEFNIEEQSLSWSDEVFRIFGWQPQQFQPSYETFLSAVHPDDRDRVDQAYQASLQNGADGYEIEHRIVDQCSGTVLEVLEKCQHIKNQHGTVIASTGMLQDITEQKRLRRASERLAQSVAASLNEIYIFDAHTLRFSFVNQGAQANLGYSLSELQHMTPLDIKPAYTQSSFDELIRPLRNHEKATQHFQTVHRDKNGDLYPVEVHLQLFEPKDEPAYFLAIVVDIRDQRKLEAQMTSLVNAASAIIWSTDSLLQVDHVSRQITEILGYEPEQLIGQNLLNILVSDMFHCDEKHLQLLAVDEMLNHDRPVRNLEHRVKNATGDWKWALVSMTPIRDVNGRLQQIVGVVTDISAQKNAELALRNLNDQLDRRVDCALDEIRRQDSLLQQQAHMVAMGEMIGNIAHQWRQPLNSLAVILMDLEDSLLYGQPNQSAIQHSMQCCNDLLAKMSSTIDDFRNFFRKDKTLVSTKLIDIIQEAVSLLETALQYHHIQIEIHAANAAVTALCYPGELSQALLCLINNAKDQIVLRQLHDGKIQIELEETPQCAVIRVIDNGGGIDEQDLPKIFDPYFSTKADGNGQGLYISKLTIEQSMNGGIDAENTVDGACFTIQLPKNNEDPCP